MTKFRLAAVLRARKAQEDARKAAVVNARSEAEAAAAGVRRREEAVDESRVPHHASAMAFRAALWARQAMAADLAVAKNTARMADDYVAETVEELTAAAVQRRTLEKLEERHAVTRRKAENTADQFAVDDLTTAAHHRRAEPEGPTS